MIFEGEVKARVQPKGKAGPWDGVTVQVSEHVRDRCQNKKLMEKGSFDVTKHKSSGFFDWDFDAILKDTGGVVNDGLLARLRADTGGHCNRVDTIPGSWGCGLATALMEYCFTDPDVGTVNLGINPFFNNNERSKMYRAKAEQYCDHIVNLQCAPDAPATEASCSAYLSAALNTDHLWIFTYDPMLNKWSVLKVANAKQKLKEDAKGFINDYGNDWYFCLCKDDKDCVITDA